MTDWRFYAQRPVTGEWMDNDVQFTSISLTEGLSTPNTGQAVAAMPDTEPLGSDGRPVWGRWDTLLYCEKDGDLDQVYIADSVTPTAAGASIQLIGASGWLAKVDYSNIYQVWKTNTFDVLRVLLDHANGKPRGLTFTYPPTLMSATTVGSDNPPPKPAKPARHKGESKSAYEGSKRYTTWEHDLGVWNSTYGQNEKFKILFWESPYILDEITNLATQTGFDWREQYTWTDRDNKVAEFKINFADDLRVVRDELVIEDGVNVAGRMQPSDDDETYANHVLAVGAGHGRKTRKQTSNFDDGRLYTARYLMRKHQHNLGNLQREADAALKRWRKIDPQIGTTTVLDIPGSIDASDIVPGNIIPVRSRYLSPHLNATALVKTVTHNPLVPGSIQIEFETQALA